MQKPASLAATGPGSEKDVGSAAGFPTDTQFFKPALSAGDGLQGVSPTDRYLLLNQKMAETLKVGVGDEIELDLGQGRHATWVIAGLIQDLTPSGNTVYMYRDVLTQELNQVNRQPWRK